MVRIAFAKPIPPLGEEELGKVRISGEILLG